MGDISGLPSTSELDAAGAFAGGPGVAYSTDSSSGFGASDALGLGALGIGAGLILGKGESPLPVQFQQAEMNVPGLMKQSGTLFGRGTDLYNQGQQAIQMAQAGQLTKPQQAELNQYQTGL